jgi:hypothetical protein
MSANTHGQPRGIAKFVWWCSGSTKPLRVEPSSVLDRLHGADADAAALHLAMRADPNCDRGASHPGRSCDFAAPIAS